MYETALERMARREAKRQEREAFRAKMEADYSTADLPSKARNLIWEKAWSDGHSEGYQAVEGHYADLADIVDAVRHG